MGSYIRSSDKINIIVWIKLHVSPHEFGIKKVAIAFFLIKNTTNYMTKLYEHNQKICIPFNL